MIGPLKLPLFTDLPIRLTGYSKCISSNLSSLLVAQNKDFGAASQTLPTGLTYIFYHSFQQTLVGQEQGDKPLRTSAWEAS